MGRPLGIIALAMTLTLASTSRAEALSPPIPTRGDSEVGQAEDFLVVDCLLPGKVRRLGRRQTYLSARRPLRTTAIDCRIRGGEYTAFDRATYESSMQVWLGGAREGEAEAQFYVGQIFEKGLGRNPDYAAAADWYRKAAEQGHSGAQTSLGFLYEVGLGVERDPVAALSWYRRASGLDDELVVLEGAEYRELLDRRQELEERNRELEDLERRLRETEKTLRQSRLEQQQDDVAEARLQATLTQLQEELEGRRLAVSRLESEVTRLAATEGASVAPEPEQNEPAGVVDFGPYHALVIGNGDYRSLPAIGSAPGDARRLADLLRDRYGFEVRLLLDATRYQILEALNRLREDLTEKDNLVLFYAGHSEEDEAGSRGWWKPIDADPTSRANWISHRVLADHLEVVPAKHVLVLAEAAYAATLTRSSIPQLPVGMSPAKRQQYLREMAARRTRLVLSSGERGTGGSGGATARFSDALCTVLEKNEGVLGASSVYRELNKSLSTSGAPVEFAPIRWSRHEGGSDFFFVAKNRVAEETVSSESSIESGK
jgi:hypothetical protein